MVRGQEAVVNGDSDSTTTKWLSLCDIAAHLGVHQESVRRYMKRHGLPGYRLGLNWRFDIAEVDAWLKTRTSYRKGKA